MSLELVSQPFEQIAHWAKTDPHRPCLQSLDQQLTFAEVHALATQLASHLRELGVKPGHRIGLDVPVGLLPLFVAACLHEAVIFFIYRSQFEDTLPFKADYLFSSHRTDSTVSEHTIAINREFLHAFGAAQPALAANAYQQGVESDCFIAFSSGTTGRAKAVVLTIEMLHQRAVATHALWPVDSSYLCTIGVGALAGFDTFYGALLAGDCYFVPDDAASNLSQIQRHNISGLKCSPIQLAELLAETRASGARLDTLQHIYAAGSVVPSTLRSDARELTSAKLWAIYGSTEAGRATMRELVDDDISNVGSAIPGTTVEVVDEAGIPVESGVDGFVRYQRYRQTTGYLDDTETTAQFFRDGWFYPGDRGHFNEQAELILSGRVTDLINVGGVKVDMYEIEQFTLRMDGVSDAAGFAYGNSAGVETFGLAVVAEEPFTSAELARVLSDTFGLSAPHGIFKLPAIARNASGKVDRSAIAEQFVALGGAS